jgi:signal transduction histidine kinase
MVRLIVLIPQRGGAPASHEIVRGLEGLGATLVLVHDAGACIESCRNARVDVVLADAALGAELEVLLAALRDAGPPVIVAGRDLPPERAVALFRGGAADCITLGAPGPRLADAVAARAEDGRRRRGAREAIHGALAPVDPRALRVLALQAEKMASVGRLAAGVAHEINNPMGFIHANLSQMGEYVGDLRRVFGAQEALQKAVAQGDLAEIRSASAALAALCDETDLEYVLSDLGKAVRESLEGSERIRHIVQDLSAFSHPESGKRVFADLNQCLDSTVSIVRPMMKHLAQVERDYAELPSVACYPMQLKQVFMNLLVNAYQAIEERVGESGETGTIWLSTRSSRDGVEIAVRDTGVGIPPEALGRIFDPFFTTKKVGAGTGLGLSTCYSIVERHGGALRVESRPGQGATFTISLPWFAEEEEEEVGASG